MMLFMFGAVELFIIKPYYIEYVYILAGDYSSCQELFYTGDKIPDKNRYATPWKPA